LRDHSRHESFRWLVQQDDSRLEHHGPRNGKHLLLSKGYRPVDCADGEHREISEGFVEQFLFL